MIIKSEDYTKCGISSIYEEIEMVGDIWIYILNPIQPYFVCRTINVWNDLKQSRYTCIVTNLCKFVSNFGGIYTIHFDDWFRKAEMIGGKFTDGSSATIKKLVAEYWNVDKNTDSFIITDYDDFGIRSDRKHIMASKQYDQKKNYFIPYYNDTCNFEIVDQKKWNANCTFYGIQGTL
jgi:hypothetical protein